MRGVMRLAGDTYATLMINYNDASISGGTRIDSSPLHSDQGSFFYPVYNIQFLVLSSCLRPSTVLHFVR